MSGGRSSAPIGAATSRIAAVPNVASALLLASVVVLLSVATLAPVPASAQDSEPESQPPSTPAPAPGVAAPETSPLSEEDRQMLGLLADLQRFSNASSEELRRELASAASALNRTRSDANRIRLAVLLTLPGAGPPDDSRALTLLDSVTARSGGGSSLKQLAIVLYAQVAERQRGMAEERKKSTAAQEKLDQLRAVERSLLLERNRNAGGAGGGGGGGGTGR